MFSRLVLLLAAVLVSLAPVGAQSLPDWAAPQAPSEPSPSVASAEAPLPPAAPAQVPLDGGLGLLALAGAGFAAHKLRQRA